MIAKEKEKSPSVVAAFLKSSFSMTGSVCLVTNLCFLFILTCNIYKIIIVNLLINLTTWENKTCKNEKTFKKNIIYTEVDRDTKQMIIPWAQCYTHMDMLDNIIDQGGPYMATQTALISHKLDRIPSYTILKSKSHISI